MSSEQVRVIGGGLAGCEAVRRLHCHGLQVELLEMRPVKKTPAHTSNLLAELVCSNSLRSNETHSAVGLLKEEMRRCGSLVMDAAERNRVPAGKALAVDRNGFARYITDYMMELPGVTVTRQEVERLDPDRVTVLATGPLTSEAMSQSLAEMIGTDSLYFYDAIAPIVTAESIDMNKAFWASRYDDESPGDYLNCPMSEEEYGVFHEALTGAEMTPLRSFEKPRFFEGCLPIEVMAGRGLQTLAFGPMKPVGLTDPRTGKRPYAVVQLRRENQSGSLFNLVGFQTRLKHEAQKQVFRLIPGLEKAEFARLGSIHRNTFIHAPSNLDEYLSLKKYPAIFMAGQITGVEGYVESAASGILAGENAARKVLGKEPVTPPETTALGGMIHHLIDSTARHFQPSNINFGLLPTAPKSIRKKERPAFYVKRALTDLEEWLTHVDFKR